MNERLARLPVLPVVLDVAPGAPPAYVPLDGLIRHRRRDRHGGGVWERGAHGGDLRAEGPPVLGEEEGVAGDVRVREGEVAEGGAGEGVEFGPGELEGGVSCGLCGGRMVVGEDGRMVGRRRRGWAVVVSKDASCSGIAGIAGGEGRQDWRHWTYMG